MRTRQERRERPETERDWRVKHGWSAEPYDACWLDCPDPDGYLKTWHRSQICLCMRHLSILEEGKLTYPGRGGRWTATYRGAPLPPETVATAWPWHRPSDELAAAV